MAETITRQTSEQLEVVPASVVPQGHLPPLRYRDLPEPVKLRRMIGPGIILAGLSLGSGEYVLWPYITFKSQFVFFWACLIGLATQFFINMEISRWTLATGETAIAGFCRLSKHFAWIFLLANIIPHMIPAWSKGAAELTAWLIWGPDAQGTLVTLLAIGSMILCGVILTAGPVIYNTVERIQMVLVSLVLVLVVVLAFLVVRQDAVVRQVTSVVTLGYPQFIPQFDETLTAAMLLGALAFAGCGGTLNLGQSDYIKDKGYGMGRYIGRITSPITGNAEPISSTGYLFPLTEPNLARWRRWWKLANTEHFLSFFLTCAFCLTTLTLISYSLLYEPDGALRPEVANNPGDYGEGMKFIRGEARQLETLLGPLARLLFLVMGVAILLTTEFGILDAASRISTGIIKVNWLRDNAHWTESRLYYLCLWSLILFGTLLLITGIVIGEKQLESALALFKISSAISGGVMCLYSATLLVLNCWALPKPLRMGKFRMLVLIWAVLFFGAFAVWTLWRLTSELLG